MRYLVVSQGLLTLHSSFFRLQSLLPASCCTAVAKIPTEYELTVSVVHFFALVKRIWVYCVPPNKGMNCDTSPAADKIVLVKLNAGCVLGYPVTHPLDLVGHV